MTHDESNMFREIATVQDFISLGSEIMFLRVSTDLQKYKKESVTA